MFALVSRREKNARTFALLSALVVTFVLATYLWVVELMILRRYLQTLFVETRNPTCLVAC
ncbi:hypothetical protein BDV98DRAFT_575025 [Pterulicium gracile]|uniref:Uncharacterized protein n=1 Tax=Pterulicium gracile TaxID=1884261 RepID=A0A5C3QAG1_9AGAR|nr:hypothetical protein BDV98DRAFT_575025 [Pterula gracilis]